MSFAQGFGQGAGMMQFANRLKEERAQREQRAQQIAVETELRQRRQQAIEQQMAIEQAANAARIQREIESEMGSRAGRLDRQGVGAEVSRLMEKGDADFAPEDAAYDQALQRRLMELDARDRAPRMGRYKTFITVPGKKEWDEPTKVGEFEYEAPVEKIEGLSRGIKNSEPTNAPAVVEGGIYIQDGKRYRFKGGDPTDPANYETVR